jgi:small-conductance mechanosensitive channel
MSKKRVRGQTKIETFVEVFFSNILSYLIDVVFILAVAPFFGIQIGLTVVTGAVAILYAIHLLKSFLYRRFWNWLLLKEHKGDKK